MKVDVRMSDPATPSTSTSTPSENLETTEEGANAYLRWAKKPWNHLGLFTRPEAIQLLRDKMVSQKRRMLMKDCVRIIYYCQVQRSSGCRYEMSICIPKKATDDDLIRIDDCNKHTCDLDSNRLRRRVLPQVEDFDRPIEKRSRVEKSATKKEKKSGQTRDIHDEEGLGHEQDPMNLSMTLNQLIPQAAEEENSNSFNDPPHISVWTMVDVDIVDLTKKPDNNFKFILNCTDRSTRFSYATPLETSSSDQIAAGLLNMMYVFGPPEELQLEGIYLNKILLEAVKIRFPSVHLVAYPVKKNNHGQIVPRREAQIMKERLFAWLVENDCSHWSTELKAMKYAHNSEWIEELGGTPMDLFYRRGESKKKSLYEQHDGIQAEQLLQNVKYEMCND